MELFDVLPRDAWISSAALKEMVRRRSKIAPYDHAALDAELVGVLASGVVVGRSDENGEWSYKRRAKRPAPPSSTDGAPGGPGFNAGLQRAHEAELRRLDEEDKRAAEARKRAWETDPHRLHVRAIVDERLAELGLMPTAFAEVAA